MSRIITIKWFNEKKFNRDRKFKYFVNITNRKNSQENPEAKLNKIISFNIVLNAQIN